MADRRTPDPPLVSIVIAAEHAEPALADCLQSIVRTDYPGDRREILVVGRQRERSGAPVASRFAARFLVDPVGRVSTARNRGIEASRGSIVVFTDPDCVVSDGWLREIVRAFDAPDVAIVGGAIVPFPAASAAERYAARRRSHSQEHVIHHPDHPFALGPNLAARAEVLKRIHGFDPAFPGGGWEDADLCWRAVGTTGGRIAYAPRAIVLHRYRTTARAFFDQHVRYGHGLALLHRKYPDRLVWRWAQRRAALGMLAAAGWRALRSLAAPGTGARDANGDRFDFLRLLGHRLGAVRAGLSR